MIKVLHLFHNSQRNPLHNDFARFIDRSQVELWGGTLTPRGPFHQDLRDLGWRSIALRASSPRRYARVLLPLAVLLRREKFDVVHAHGTEAAAVGLSAARLAGVPLRVQTRHHADERLFYNGRRALQADRFVGHHLADVVIALSGAVRRALLEIDGVPESKIALIPNGYDWNRLHVDAENVQNIRRQYQLGGGLLLGAVGRLSHGKAQHILLEAMAQPIIPSDTRLLLAGIGPDEALLREQAQRLGLAERVIFLGQRSDVFDVMAACDIIVHPSLSEAQNQVINEAMALGRPVVATDVGAAPEVIFPNRSGWLALPNDAASLAQALAEAIRSPDLRRDFAAAGQHIVLERYPIQKMTAQHLELYQSQLALRHRAAIER